MILKRILISASLIVTIIVFGEIIFGHVTRRTATITRLQTTLFSNPNTQTEEVLTNRRKYAVLSAATPTGTSQNKYNYVFFMPITILAWQRIGFTSIVLISGNQTAWESDPCLKTVKQYMDDLNVLTLFLEVPHDDNLVTVSQVSRIYAAALFEEKLDPEDYLITSDIDLWPLSKAEYALPQHKKVLVLNANCCGNYTFKGVDLMEVAMGNVGATVETWRDIITSRGDKLPSNATDILAIFSREFGAMAREAPVKGQRKGWNMDQRMLSLLLATWMGKNSESLVQFVRRKLSSDRLCRSRWFPNSIEGKMDAHVPHNVHVKKNFKQVEEVIALMFKTNDLMPSYKKIRNYYTDFSKVLKTVA